MLLFTFPLPLSIHLRISNIGAVGGGAWEAQSVKCLTLDLSAGSDLRVVSSGGELGSTLGMEPT